jgi:hypothetical protein
MYIHVASLTASHGKQAIDQSMLHLSKCSFATRANTGAGHRVFEVTYVNRGTGGRCTFNLNDTSCITDGTQPLMQYGSDTEAASVAQSLATRAELVF